MRIAIIGCGTLGEAVLGGMLASQTTEPSNITVTTRRREHAAELAETHGVRATTDNVAAVEAADIVVVSVKPQRARELLPTLAGALADKLVIATCAGVRLRQYEAWMPSSAVIRAMPNTPCLIREGMTVLSPGQGVTEQQLEAARAIFAASGRCIVLEEKHMDAVTGLSGSGPAFAFVVLEALADGGVMMGLPRDAAVELAAQTMQGAARLVLETDDHPAALKDQVTTPAGCTIAGLLTMEDGKIRSTLARAIQEATNVASRLGDAGDAPNP
ncbi:MAG: pyrroline-5-carboxylate reductase [Planctomycetes bacterium]|nr:pyrroline-5-carboxylate reductase [Planctomycetota bacterium]